MKTKAWQEYEQGVDYKTRIGLYNTVDLNERFFAGNQWAGIPHEGLPTPVVNFIRYASAWKIAAVTDRRLKMSFFAEGISDGGDTGIYARQISEYCDMLWERLKMDYLTKEGLKQAAITGDYVQYFYWDPEIKTGQALTGDINTALIDNVNYYPGNPNSPDVQSQPYIIIAFREILSKVREEAKRNGCENADEIAADEDNEYTSGDRGKVELGDFGKCNVLLKMYKKDGKVWCEKSVRNAVIQPEKDTGLTMYPIALMNWDTRMNCCHGTAEVTGLIPNQVFINKILALAQLGQVQTSFPKVIYDKTRIREWTNRVAGAIAVNGDIGGAAQYLAPPVSSYDAWRGLDVTLQTTMKMMGANDVTLGNIRNPDNASAFIATRDAAMVPLQSQQERFYSFVEDVGHIWLDFIKGFYKAGRMIPVMDGGQRVFVPIPEGELDTFTMNLRIDVGPSSMWSEIQVLQTLDNLLRGGKINFKQYLERMPDGHIPMKDGLIADMEREQEAGQGQSSGGAEEIINITGALAEAGKIPAQLAEGVINLARQGAGAEEILAALKGAAEQGQIPAEVVQEIAAALQGQSAAAAPPRQSAEETQSTLNDDNNEAPEIVGITQALAEAGKIPPQLAEGVMKLAQQGAGSENILEALKGAAEQGQIPVEAVQEIAAALQGQTQQSQSETHETAAAEIAEAVQTLAESGDIPGDIAQEIMRIAQQGADAGDMMQALKIMAEQGRISEDALQFVASVLSGGAHQADEQQTQEGVPVSESNADKAAIIRGLKQSGKLDADMANSILDLLDKGDTAAIAQLLEAARRSDRITAQTAQVIASALE